jgi:predicted transcriptional regulator
LLSIQEAVNITQGIGAKIQIGWMSFVGKLEKDDFEVYLQKQNLHEVGSRRVIRHVSLEREQRKWKM